MLANRIISCAICNITSDTGMEYTLEYSIIVDETKICDEILESYGVLVLLVCEERVEKKCVHSITMNAGEINKIISYLSRNTITPEFLLDALDDYQDLSSN